MIKMAAGAIFLTAAFASVIAAAVIYNIGDGVPARMQATNVVIQDYWNVPPDMTLGRWMRAIETNVGGAGISSVLRFVINRPTTASDYQARAIVDQIDFHVPTDRAGSSQIYSQ